jgi:hypothetical protein
MEYKKRVIGEKRDSSILLILFTYMYILRDVIALICLISLINYYFP